MHVGGTNVQNDGLEKSVVVAPGLIYIWMVKELQLSAFCAKAIVKKMNLKLYGEITTVFVFVFVFISIFLRNRSLSKAS